MKNVAVPRLAATLVLLARNAATAPLSERADSAATTTKMNDIHVLMVKRHGGARFLPNAYVFPGGCLEPEDAALAAARVAADRLVPEASQTEALRRRLAALRELSEETGCCPTADHVLRPSDTREGAAGAERLQSVARQLVPLGRWITPDIFPHRYDTYFYGYAVDAGARGPAGAGAEAVVAPQEVPLRRQRSEVTELVWVSPLEALRQHENRADPFTLPEPTYFLMHSLSTIPSFAALQQRWASFDAAPPMNDMEIEPVVTSSVTLVDGSHAPRIPTDYYHNFGEGSCLPAGLYHFPDPRSDKSVLSDVMCVGDSDSLSRDKVHAVSH